MHVFGLLRKPKYLEETPEVRGGKSNPQPRRCKANMLGSRKENMKLGEPEQSITPNGE